MKKTFFLFSLALLCLAVNAQWTSSGSTIYYNGGNVGIGTSTPRVPLEVNGTYYLNRPAQMGDVENTIGIASGSYLGMAPSDLSSTNNSYMLFLFPDNNSFRIGTGYDGHLGTGIYRDIQFGRYTGNPYMTIKDGGNVGIGTTNPQSLLAVKGTITSQQVVVTLTGWSDYVFDPAYRLMPLKDLKRFIHTYRHLPDMPSADSVLKAGLDLGAGQAGLLKKIEELTLYATSQDQRIDVLQKEVSALKDLQKEVEALKSAIKNMDHGKG
jgi:hypothetical protein